MEHPQRQIDHGETLLPSLVDVVIVGGGLSGLFLASVISQGVDVLVIEKNNKPALKDAMYLVSQKIAQKWGLGDDLMINHQPLISGTITFNRSGQVVDLIEPNEDDSYGFTALAQTELETNLKTKVDQQKRPIFHGVSCQQICVKPEGQIEVKTQESTINCNLVIDATGWAGNVIHQYYGQEDYVVRALFGGNYQTTGFNPRLLYFIDGLPNNNRNWIMPVTDRMAEVMAAQEIYCSETKSWWGIKAEEELTNMIRWYKKKGLTIVGNSTENLMAFREEPAKRRFFQGLVVPFGEAAGLNSPLVGQLIDVLPQYAKVLAKIIQEAKNKKEWELVGKRFYEEFLKRPPFYYLLHSIARERRMRPGETRVSANSLLMKAVRDTFDKTTLWRLLQENGFTVSELIYLLQKRPLEVIGWILSSTPSIFSLIFSNPDLFLQFYLASRERLINKLQPF